MAAGAVLEFVPAHKPEAIQMDVSRYKVIQQKKPTGHNGPKAVSREAREGDDDDSTDSVTDNEYDDSDENEYGEQDGEGYGTSDELEDSDSMEDSEKSDTDYSSSDDEEPENADDLINAKTNSKNPEYKANVPAPGASDEISGKPSQFYDINENSNDRGTRSPKRIHKSWNPTARAPIGLVNRGVTCYMNSAVQAILHLPAIGRYLLEVLNGSHEKVDKNSVTYDLALLFKKLMEKKSPVFPSKILRRLEDINPMLDEWQQEDSHEFYMSLISRLQEDSVPRGEKLRSSIIHDIFGGSAEQKVTCQRCHSVSTTTQDFYDLPVSFSQKESEGSYTLEQSIKDFFTPEVISAVEKGTGYQCEKCKRRTKAVKQIKIADAPEYLTVHIKRFKMDGNVSKKVKDTMAYPLEINLTQFETDPKPPLQYKLIAVIVHEGRTVSSGHYIALARQPSNEWMMYDDELTRKIPESYVKSHPSAYILLYSRLLEKPNKKSNGVAKSAAAVERRPSDLQGSSKKQLTKKSKMKDGIGHSPKKVKASSSSSLPRNKLLKKTVTKKRTTLQSTGSSNSPKSHKAAHSSEGDRRVSANSIDEIFGKSKRRKPN